MISRKLIDKMSLSELQAHIKNHKQELEMMEKEAARRTSLFESRMQTHISKMVK